MKALLVVVAFAAAALAAPAEVRAQGRDDIPKEHRPPPGMCRIWIDDVPPSQQPAPTDCPTAIRRKPPNARVIFGDPVKGAPPVKPLREPEKERGKKPEDPKKKPDGEERTSPLGDPRRIPPLGGGRPPGH